MKINNLEKKDFSEKIDWDRAFPRKSSTDFLNQVSQNWQNLERREFNKKGNSALRLYREFKPPKGRINEFTIFYLWLCLCLKRPWEKNWKITFSEKSSETIWLEVDKVLEQLKISFPDNFQIQTLENIQKEKTLKALLYGLRRIRVYLL